MFSGKMCRMMSLAFCGGAFTTLEADAVFAGGVTPTPAFERLMVPRPMNSASVVTISK